MWGQPPNPFGMVPPMDPTLGVPPLRMPPMAAAVQAQPQSHAFLREGGPGRTIIGIIADALAGAAGGQGTYAPLMLQKRRLDLEQQREAARELRKANEPVRTQVGEDLIQYDPASKQTSVLYHGASNKAPYRWETNDGSLAELGPDGQPRIVYKDPTPKVDYVQAKDPVTGAITLVPRVLGSAASGPTPGTVKKGYRFKGGNPADPSAWEAVGGPTPQASGTFR